MSKNGTVYDLEEAEMCYSPQEGAAKDAVNMVGMAAANNLRGLHPSHMPETSAGPAPSCSMCARS